VLQATQTVAFLASEDLARSEQFFQELLDLPLRSRTPHALVFEVEGASLRVTKVDGLRPQPFTVFGWQVLDLRSAIEDLRDRGIVMLRYGGMDQDDDGIWTTGDGDMVAWFHDPDSNVLSLTQLVTAWA
jgi:catechol 2,3-dioxygenase-like lactoylglutathione lyase family enzyme